MRLDIQGTLNDVRGDANHLRVMTGLMREHKGYRQLADREGHCFPTFEAFCVEPQPFGLGYLKEDIDRIIGERKSAEARASTARPLSQQEIGKGKPGPGRSKKTGDVVTRFERGNSADYLSSKIARDKPEIHEQQKAGGFKSVRAAAKAAGLVKPEIRCVAEPTYLARQVRAKFTAEQIAELIRLLGEARP